MWQCLLAYFLQTWGDTDRIKLAFEYRYKYLQGSLATRLSSTITVWTVVQDVPAVNV